VIENPKSLELGASRWKRDLNPQFWLQAGLVSVIFLLLFAPALPSLYNDWFEFKQFSHGLLVPFISVYLVWQRKGELRATPIRSSSWGLIVVLPALLLGLMGKAIGDAFSERIGMVLCLNGLVWLLFGWQFYKAVSFALLYLFLMIPLPYLVVKEVAYQLRIVDAVAAASVLRLLGVPVYRESYYLHLPEVTLEVADLCSGISSLFSLFALGGAYVYFTPMRARLKLLAVLSTFPFAVIINLLRIILTAALSYHVSLSFLNMMIHELTGTITFFIALALFILLCEYLQRRFSAAIINPAKAPHASSMAQNIPARDLPAAAEKPWLPSILAMVALIAAVYLANNLSSQQQMRLSMELSSVAPQPAGYQATDSAESGFYKDPNAEIQLSRTYSMAGEAPVEVYVGFRGKQQGEKQLQSPKLQIPYGWNYVWIEPAQLPAGGANRSVSANWMLMQNNNIRYLVLYWYQVGDTTFSGELKKRLALVRNTIFRRRSDAAAVRLATPLPDLDKIDHAKSKLAGFAAELYPSLLRVLPQ
jgi:EpsI family protein